jgi:hypothetical protein
MKIAIAGASGLIGSALGSRLRAQGHDVRRLVRRAVAAPDEIAWHPEKGELDPHSLAGTDACINLAGENIGAGRWTAQRRERILRSRVDATRTLVAALTRLARKPDVLLNASAAGFYGDRGDETLTEASASGHGFLAEVCRAWETEAQAAAAASVRVVRLRFGVVLAPGGGALAKMLPLFRCGLGGRWGSGEQWMSWVHIDDVVGVIQHALSDPRCTGPLNVAAPGAVTNAEFAATLGRVLQRPAILPAPAWVLRLVFGRMADEALLASVRTMPRQLSAVGYSFRHPTLEGALRAVVVPGL